jgi:cysteine desulfurase
MDSCYLDNNATTRPDPAVVDAMMACMTEGYGNPSSVHRFGQRARQAVEEARGQVAQLIGCSEAEVLFTGGGTESINTAIRGLLGARTPRKKVVISSVEHSATRELCAVLAKEGVEVIPGEVDVDGRLDFDQLKWSLAEDVALVSIMWANNETGVLFEVEKIAAMCKEHRVPFHSDGTQALGKIPVDVAAAGIDAMSFASHKFHGPKGVGGLFVRRGLRYKPLVVGGPQERGRRGGTENVPGIVGLGKAAELAREALPQMRRVASLRDRLESGILEKIPRTRVNGRTDARIANTTNIGFYQLEAEAILLLLSEQGVYASAGAACSSGSLEPSAVLRAMKIDDRYAHGAIRFSLSRMTTDVEVERALDVLPRVIERLRAVLPVA